MSQMNQEFYGNPEDVHYHRACRELERQIEQELEAAWAETLKHWAEEDAAEWGNVPEARNLIGNVAGQP